MHLFYFHRNAIHLLLILISFMYYLLLFQPRVCKLLNVLTRINFLPRLYYSFYLTAAYMYMDSFHVNPKF